VGQERRDGLAPPQEPDAISPAAVEGIGGRNDGRIACVPGILRRATFWAAVSAADGGRSIIAWLFSPIARSSSWAITSVGTLILDREPRLSASLSERTAARAMNSGV
jgi:hypothetical protein